MHLLHPTHPLSLSERRREFFYARFVGFWYVIVQISRVFAVPLQLLVIFDSLDLLLCYEYPLRERCRKNSALGTVYAPFSSTKKIPGTVTQSRDNCAMKNPLGCRKSSFITWKYPLVNSAISFYGIKLDLLTIRCGLITESALYNYLCNESSCSKTKSN